MTRINTINIISKSYPFGIESQEHNTNLNIGGYNKFKKNKESEC